MKVLLVCVGSRGDAEPFCSLASKLLEGGHTVDMFCQPELQSLIPDGVKIHSFPFTQFDFYKYAAAPSKGQDHENMRVRFVGAVTEIITHLVFPCSSQVLEVAQGCNVIVCSALARSLCFALSKKLGMPSVLLHLQPLVPTRLFPHYSDSDECIKAVLEGPAEAASDANLETYWLLEKYQHEFLQDGLDELYSQLNIAPTITFEETQSILSGNDPNVHLVNAFSGELLPSVTDAGSHLYQMGALADSYIPINYQPNPKLEEFLQAHCPVCVGFGSMPYDKVDLILQVLEESGKKAVLVGQALTVPSDNEWAKDNIRQVDAAPYAWLLPQCSMMLCHGGAGVTHATLHAGIPIVISPFMGDQFFFADLVQAKGLGARAGSSLPAATKEDFLAAIDKASQCTAEAKAFGERTRAQPKGVEQCTKLLEDIVAA